MHFRKVFQQGTIGKNPVGPKILFMDEMFGSSSDMTKTHVFMTEEECLRDQWR